MDSVLDQAFHAFDNGRYDDAERLYASILAQCPASQYEQHKQAAHGLAFTYCFQNRFDQARERYASLYRLVQEARDVLWQAIVLHQRGVVERMAGNFDSALALFQQEYTFRALHLPDDPAGFAANLYEQGYILLKSGNVVQAKTTMRRSLEMAQQANDAMCLGCTYRGLGEISIALGEREQARQSLLLVERTGFQTGWRPYCSRRSSAAS